MWHKLLGVYLCFILLGCTSSLDKGRVFHTKSVEWRDIPGWQTDDFKAVLPALLNSCTKATPEMVRFCQGLNRHVGDDNEALRLYFENNLKPYQVISRGSSTGKITGYYEAELTGTREHTNGVQVPIYGQPYDYTPNKKTYPREKIETTGIEAPIIAWADDPVELFIAQVQGSGRLTTPSGEVIHLGYAGNNGYPFTGIGQILIDEGVDTGTARSMPSIRDWLQSHPQKAQKLMRKNKRYIYFREIEGETPYGTAGVVLTPERSVAVDTTYIPMHTVMFLNTTTPDGTPIQKMVVAQDTGAAIKGGIRADYFWGHGEMAFEQAGRMNQKGSYYVLIPKE
ncbi:MAG: MltA domain-containing protein [Alphaproteobacteria bacterium]|nr:MltA domain-containing protein [Alphaproteobacteria bacterium]